MLTLDVLKIIKHRQVQGVSLIARSFFWAWSLWNLFWYANLHQWLSWYGAIAVMIPQTVWLGLLIYYRRHDAVH